jgi:hypothetical protein
MERRLRWEITSGQFTLGLSEVGKFWALLRVKPISRDLRVHGRYSRQLEIEVKQTEDSWNSDIGLKGELQGKLEANERKLERISTSVRNGFLAVLPGGVDTDRGAGILSGFDAI